MQMEHTNSSRGGGSGGAGDAVKAEHDSFLMLAANPAYA